MTTATSTQREMELKLEEYRKIALVGKAVDALILAIKENNIDPHEMGEFVTNLAVRKINRLR